MIVSQNHYLNQILDVHPLDIPTRITENTTSLVDLVYVQNQDYLSIQGTLPRVADHDGTLVSFHSHRPKVLPQTRTIYDYSKIN